MSDQGDAGQTGDTADAGQKQDTGGQADAGHTGARTFTQEDFDRALGERLAAERRKYADYNDLKKAAAEYQKLQDAQKSDLEKTQERAAQLEQELQQVRQDNTKQAAISSLISAATQAGVVDPDAAAQLIGWQSVSDEKGHDPASLVAALVEQKPYLKGRMGSADNGPRGGDTYQPAPGLDRLVHAYSSAKKS